MAGGLSEGGQAFLLNAAGFCLRALGRLREAVEPMEAALRSTISQKNWIAASRTAGNLSGLQLTRGEVEAAVEYGRRAVEYADRSGDGFLRMAMRTPQADAEHQADRLEVAEKLFREAERLQQKRQPEYPLLYSLQSYLFCDLLLAQRQAAEARRRATQTIEWARTHLGLLAVALGYLTLGRAALALGDLPEALQHLDEAVDDLRDAGVQEYLARGLLARAEFHRRQDEFDLV